MPHTQGHSRPTGTAYHPSDYYQKYNDNEWGQEWAPYARVWRVYLDEAQIYDLEMTEGWKDTLDVFLVFAGLFSAIEATFIAISVHALQPDYGQVNAFLPMEQIALLQALASGEFPSTVYASPVNLHSVPSLNTTDICVNGLWFVSLALPLCAALAAVLIKQWIQHYLKYISGTPIESVRVRQFRFAGLERWRVSTIIGFLPIVLYIALFLFLIGSSIFVVPLNLAVGSVVGVITALALGIYITSNLLPLFYLDCPYKTPIAITFYDFILNPAATWLGTICCSFLTSMNSWWLWTPLVMIICVGIQPFSQKPSSEARRQAQSRNSQTNSKYTQ
jgi:hypothetical protein